MADAVIVYSDYALPRYAAGGVCRRKLFVAHNTLALTPRLADGEKQYFLFVGTLKRYKRAEDLVRLYRGLLTANPGLPPLHIVGDGELRESLVAETRSLGLTEKVVFRGRIADEAGLEAVYRHAIASVSPYQAGLSVLQSLAMGVPFVTRRDSITGGERFNVVHDRTGLLADDDAGIAKAMLQLAYDPVTRNRLAQGAFDHFVSNCSVERMVGGFLSAVQYATA